MTLVELLVAAALTAALGAGVVMLLAPADAIVRAEQDAVDVQQRLRVIADALTAATIAAAEVVPIADGVTLVMRDASGVELTRRTFLFRRDTRQVMLIEGASTMPLVDRVAGFTVDLLDAPAGRLRATVSVESPATSGRPVAPRIVVVEAAPRRGR